MDTVSDRIIDALGGTTAVSRKSETPISTVHSWRTNGIPRSRLSHLKLIAEREGTQIDWETGRLVASDGVSANHTGSVTAQAVAVS